MSENIKVGYFIPPGVKEKLGQLATLDHRSMSSELVWLVEQECDRRGLIGEGLDAGSNSDSRFSD